MITAFFGGLPRIGLARSATNVDKGIIVRQDEGIHILTGRRKVPMNIKISKAQNGLDTISFCTEDMNPGRKMRVHKLFNND